MSKSLELADWRSKAHRYRELAGTASNPTTQKLLDRLAVEADAIADDIEERMAMANKPGNRHI